MKNLSQKTEASETEGNARRRKSVGASLLRAAGLLVVTAMLSFPWWSPWALAQVVRSFGGEVGYSRPSGYHLMEFRELTLALPTVEITAARIQSYNPLGWMLGLLGRDLSRPYVRIEGLRVLVHLIEKEDVPHERETPAGLAAAFQQAERILHAVDRWAPMLELEDGEIAVFEDPRLVSVRSLTWKERTLSMEASFSDDGSASRTVNLRAVLGNEGWTLHIEMPDPLVLVDLDLNLKASENPKMNGAIVWLENRLTFHGQWGNEGWLPTSAGVDQGQWTVRRADGLEFMPWEELQLAGTIQWEQERAAVDLSGVVQTPKTWPERLRKIAFSLQADADLERLVLKAIDASSGGVDLKLEEPLVYAYESGWTSGIFQADAAIPLDGWGVETLRGTLFGSLRGELGADDSQDKLWFALTGSDGAWDGWEYSKTSLSGWVDRGQVAIDHLRLHSKFGSSLEGKGSYSWEDKTWGPTQLFMQWSGEAMPQKLQQKRFTPGAFDLRLAMEGPQHTVRHAGTLVWRDWEFSGVHPLDASIQWHGEGFDRWSDGVLSVKSEQGGSCEAQIGALRGAEGDWMFSLAGMKLGGPREVPSLVQQQPAELRIQRTGDSPGWGFQLSPLVLVGGCSRIAVAGSFQSLESCSWELEVVEMDPAAWVDLWMKEGIPEIAVSQVFSRGVVNAGTLRQESHWAVAWAQGAQGWSMRGASASAEDALHIDSLEIHLDAMEDPWLSLSAKLPYQMQMKEGTPVVALTESEDLQLHLRMPRLDQSFPIKGWSLPEMLTNADIVLDLKGTLEQPEGTARVGFSTRTAVGARERINSQWSAELSLAGNDVQIHRLQVVSGEANLDANGSISLPAEVLGNLRLMKAPIPWKQSKVRFTVENADLLPLTGLFPEILRPTGSLSADVSGSFDAGFDGDVHLQGLHTAPIFPFGAVRDVEARIVFSDKKAELHSLSSRIGRETLHGEGWYSWGDSEGHGFDVSFSGERIPLVRQAGILLRSDLKLRASQAPGAVPLIGGAVNLRDGVFLMDLTVLLQGGSGARSVKARPPYFSVEAMPFRDWVLDLQVTGDSFMRARTPVVDALLSADLRLGGTLGEPLVHGTLSFDEGWVKFPFASFEVERGMVRLDRANPFDPRVELTGIASRLGYRLQLDVRGQADQPEVQFSSSPALDNERILLMVLAGEDPSGTVQYSATQRASKIGTYLAQGLFSGMDSGDADWMNRLNISWGNKLSQSGRETVDASFQLNRVLTMVGEYDEYDEWNAGLRWRILPLAPEAMDASAGGEP